ncbi:MAG TPA: copper-binding protein [Acidobacteriota bacterium]|nr:copper-binding protein [Acidobacteriota bacterium]
MIRLQKTFVVVILFSLLWMACKSESPPQKRYTLNGQIVELVPSTHKALIAHDEIKGFMAAMTMSYEIRDDHYSKLAVGDEITGTLVVQGNEVWLEGLKITKKAKP